MASSGSIKSYSSLMCELCNLALLFSGEFSLEFSLDSLIDWSMQLISVVASYIIMGAFCWLSGKLAPIVLSKEESSYASARVSTTAPYESGSGVDDGRDMHSISGTDAMLSYSPPLAFAFSTIG